MTVHDLLMLVLLLSPGLALSALVMVAFAAGG
jgi:multisubunit Na+/H+ antiporter MnhB subunit